MTLIPPGAQLAPIDLPPPPPSADPREPSPSTTISRSRAGARTPVRHKSPNASRASSPVPPISHRTSAHSAGMASPPDPVSPGGVGGPALIQPIPRNVHSLSPTPSVPIQTHHHLSYGQLGHHHLSRPSSPSSIHSSSSAIFERDIELPSVASLSMNPNGPHQGTPGLNHKPSRLFQPSHGSNLDHTVPAVLDDAVEALTAQTSSQGVEGLEIEAPAAANGGIGMARQSSSSLANINQGRKISSGPGAFSSGASRSPSPISIASRSSGVTSPVQSPPIMGQISTQSLNSGKNVDQSSPTISPTGAGASITRPPLGQRLSTGPLLPGGWASGFGSSTSNETSPGGETSLLTTVPPPPAATTEEPVTPLNPLPTHLSPSKEKRRISFISYNDLLLSVPTTVTPLGEITSGALSPDHLPGTVSPKVAVSRSPLVPSGPGVGIDGSFEGDRWDIGSGGSQSQGLGFGGGEGEWQREGLGKGLEERLESLVQKGT